MSDLNLFGEIFLSAMGAVALLLIVASLGAAVRGILVGAVPDPSSSWGFSIALAYGVATLVVLAAAVSALVYLCTA